MTKELLNCRLFSGLNENELNEILKGIHFQLKFFPKEAVVKLYQDECNSLYIVTKGILRGEMTDMKGKVLKVEDIAAPNTVAPAFIFGKNNKFPVNVISSEDSELMIVPKQEFINLLQTDQRILVNYLNIVSNKAQFLSSRLNLLSLKDLKAKLAHYLLEQTQNGKIISFTMPNNQTKLADYFGVARPSLARSFKKLIKEGIIKAERNDVKILKIDELRNIIS